MTDLLHLRSYQRECIDRIYDAHHTGTRRPAVVLPTGSGKTVIFSHMAAEHIAAFGTRVLILVHRDELADQALDKLRQLAPHLDVGKVKAQDDEVNAQVVVASVQTLARANRRKRLVYSELTGTKFGLIVTDECHHGAAASYQAIYADFPDANHAGFTATLVRGDGVGLGDTWDDVVYTRSVLWMIAENHLVDVRGVAVDIDSLNLDAVKKTGRDFQSGDLGAAMQEAGAPAIIAQAMEKHAADRRCIVFTPTVGMAHAVAEALTDQGTPCGVVDGTTPRDVRRTVYDDFRSGKIQALVNCMVLTEGFDAPWADCAVIARPTQSPGLYVQMVGRVLRPWPDKKDALVLDMTGTGGRLSTLIDLAPGEVRTIQPNESLAEAAVRTEEEANKRVSAGSLAFALRHRDMDLFTSSSQAWLRSNEGVMFIALKDGFVFLWPGRDAAWDVCGSSERPGKKWVKIHEDLPLGTAMAWAETEADEYATFSVAKKASWRKKPASPAVIAMARSVGLTVPDGKVPQGELSDRISVALASKVFDRYVKKVDA